MARKKTDTAPPPAQSEPVQAENAPAEPVSDTNGTAPEAEPPPDNGNQPAIVFSYIVAKDTFIQASIWQHFVTTAQGQFTAHEVSVRKRYKDKDGNWQSIDHFRCSELYAVQHALSKAEAWILDVRAAEMSCPF